MGVEPFLVASTVEAVMDQRLVRRLCPNCKTRFSPTDEDLPDDFPRDLLAEGTIFQPGACRECRNLGYRGRLGIYELLITTNEVRQLAHDRASSWKMTRCAIDQGMRTLRQDGWRKVAAGQTSLDEVARTAKADFSGLAR
jgi:general secretion pathway protein E/type IV pilus assembly protein PilB